LDLGAFQAGNLKQRKTNLDPKAEEPFQVLERINDNAYSIDLLGEYQVFATFNVADLSPFDNVEADSRTNPFEKRRNDTTSLGKKVQRHNTQPNKLTMPSGLVTRQ
jgi:hypothetical protein